MSMDLPHSFGAEVALLGAVMVNNRAYDLLADRLLPKHFYDPKNVAVYVVMQKLIAEGRVADPVTMLRFFPDDDEPGPLVVGAAYLTELVTLACPERDVDEYMHIVLDCYHKRRLIEAGNALILAANEEDVDDSATHIQEDHERALFDLAELRPGQDGPQPISYYAEQAIAAVEAAKESGVVGISTGLVDLDAKLGGLHDTDLIIVAGRPSMGKTALATTIGFNVAGDAIPVLGFSLEMSGEQLAMRQIGGESGISSHKLRLGGINTIDMECARAASFRISKYPFFIDDRPSLTIEAVRSTTRRMKRRHGIRLVIVDYLQLLTSKGENRVQEISHISRGLKALAKELVIPVLAVAQLSRLVEQRTPPRPMLSDLRESGSIEQDADTVLLIYRAAYYHEQKKPVQKVKESNEAFDIRDGDWVADGLKIENKAEINVAKQRHGPVGTINLRFKAEATRFENLDDRRDEG